MKSAKAQALLPDNLLAEIQKYIQGEVIYIPKPHNDRKRWGENNGAKVQTAQRNSEMQQSYRAGVAVVELADFYGLAEDTVRKIVYGK